MNMAILVQFIRNRYTGLKRYFSTNRQLVHNGMCRSSDTIMGVVKWIVQKQDSGCDPTYLPCYGICGEQGCKYFPSSDCHSYHAITPLDDNWHV